MKSLAKTNLSIIFFLALHFTVAAQASRTTKKPFVIAYFSGSEKDIDSIAPTKLTHIIFSFVSMRNSQLLVLNANDSLRIKKLVTLKKTNPNLKVMVALGGWGGCKDCADTFNKTSNRVVFANSAKKMLNDFNLDGFDLDWEYPTIEGFPGHKFGPADKDNFTDLFIKLRKAVGPKKVLSFAAGGFDHYLRNAVNWPAVMKYVNFVNLMTYDLVNGNSTVTGHHTPLYSAEKTTESTDNAVAYLLKLGIPQNKLVIGAAFYARTWKNVDSTNNGRYNNGQFEHFIGFKQFEKRLSTDIGYKFFWDDATHSPYAYNPKTKEFATFDDKRSMVEKTKYVIRHHLGGIMFWELSLDKPNGGLLDAINTTIIDSQ